MLHCLMVSLLYQEHMSLLQFMKMIGKRSPALTPILPLSYPCSLACCSCLFSWAPGIIWCQILDGHLEEAEHQLEFLKEVQQSLGKSEVRAPWGHGVLQGRVPPSSHPASPPVPSTERPRWPDLCFVLANL